LYQALGGVSPSGQGFAAPIQNDAAISCDYNDLDCLPGHNCATGAQVFFAALSHRASAAPLCQGSARCSRDVDNDEVGQVAQQPDGLGEVLGLGLVEVEDHRHEAEVAEFLFQARGLSLWEFSANLPVGSKPRIVEAILGAHLRVGSAATDAYRIFGPAKSGELLAGTRDHSDVHMSMGWHVQSDHSSMQNSAYGMASRVFQGDHRQRVGGCLYPVF